MQAKSPDLIVLIEAGPWIEAGPQIQAGFRSWLRSKGIDLYSISAPSWEATTTIVVLPLSYTTYITQLVNLLCKRLCIVYWAKHTVIGAYMLPSVCCNADVLIQAGPWIEAGPRLQAGGLTWLY